MKTTIFIITMLFLGAGIVLVYNAYNSDTVIDAKEVEINYFDNLGPNWTTERFKVDIDQLEVILAAAKYAKLDYVSTTTAHNSETGKMKVGYESFGVLNTSFELFPCHCNDGITAISP